LRRANFLAKRSLIAAGAEKCRVVAAEHVRIASTRLYEVKKKYRREEQTSLRSG
jgi:hypothetical protein